MFSNVVCDKHRVEILWMTERSMVRELCGVQLISLYAVVLLEWSSRPVGYGKQCLFVG